jgi:ribA/ribD-fused uncharacterized protein
MAPPLDVDSLVRRVVAGDKFRYRFFWGHKPRPDGQLGDSVFSQWWASAFTVDGQRYAHAEQFMMAGKARLFGDSATLAEILAASSPAACKALGRKVRGYDEARWAAARFDLVTRGNVAKFGQDPALAAYLARTGTTILVEASPVDKIWGIGMAADDEGADRPQKWRGLNLLGFALVRARGILAGELPPP